MVTSIVIILDKNIDINNKIKFKSEIISEFEEMIDGKVKLGDIAVLINGDRGKNYPSQKEIITSGGIPFVNAGHLNGRAIEFEAMNYITPEKI